MRSLSIAAAVAAVWCASVAGSARAQAPLGTGTFVDRSGAPHAWSLTPAHALLWDKRPYVPIGGSFVPRYLAVAATEENWGKDVEALSALKARGLLDVLIDPVVSAPDVPAAAWQRLVDYLDAGGFRYGIGFGVGVAAPLGGTVVRPSAYRLAGLREADTAAWTVPDADSARYVLADGRDGALIRAGQVKVQNGAASVLMDARAGEGAIALLYPHKALAAPASGGLPDLWSGFDAYRDRLLDTLAKVKFGPGLRFFVDPLRRLLSIAGESDYLVPDSPYFRLAWEAWLSRAYGSTEELMTAWGLQAREVKTFEQAARLIPLGVGPRGMPYFVDPVGDRLLETDGYWQRSRYWADLRKCRDSAVLEYMGGMADLLKREIADVPVVYTYTDYEPLLTGATPGTTYDGIGVAAYGRGTALVRDGVDAAYSLAGQCRRPVWCLVTETLDAPPSARQRAGYASRTEMAYDLERLRAIGVKGVFVRGYQEAPGSPFQLLGAGEQLAWLQEYANRVASAPDLATSSPRLLAFPTNAAGVVSSGPVGESGVWWVPSPVPGRPLVYGSSYAGYTATLPEGETTVIWSLRGPRLTRLLVRDPKALQVTTADGTPIKVKPDAKQHTVTLTIDEAPVLVRAAESEVFPIEAAEDTLKQACALYDQGVAAKMPVQPMVFSRDRALAAYNAHDWRLSYAMASELLGGLIDAVQPYLWLEAESAPVQSFSEVIRDEAASGGAYLTLSSDTKPGREGYAAQFRFGVPVEDTYSIWIAVTPPGPAASPFTWVVDTGETHPGEEAVAAGGPYLGDRFLWLNLGRVRLAPGEHSFTLRAAGRAPATNRFQLAMDALLVTRRPFSPRGILRPQAAEIDDSKPVPSPVAAARPGKGKR